MMRGLVSKPAVISETAAAALPQGAGQQCRPARRKRTLLVHVENFPAELQAVLFTPGHGPTFGQTEIDFEEAIAANIVTLPGLPGIGIVEGIDGRRTVGEDVGIGSSGLLIE